VTAEKKARAEDVPAAAALLFSILIERTFLWLQRKVRKKKRVKGSAIGARG